MKISVLCRSPALILFLGPSETRDPQAEAVRGGVERRSAECQDSGVGTAPAIHAGDRYASLCLQGPW